MGPEEVALPDGKGGVVVFASWERRAREAGSRTGGGGRAEFGGAGEAMGTEAGVVAEGGVMVELRGMRGPEGGSSAQTLRAGTLLACFVFSTLKEDSRGKRAA